MVDSQEIREDFALRLSQALDRMQDVRSGRGRNKVAQAIIKTHELLAAYYRTLTE